METARKSLKDRITSRGNIYSAIYCIESYVFEKGLLNTEDEVLGVDKNSIASNDLELFYALSDKYNHSLITSVIDICVDKLNKLLESEDELFEISVYFKLKSYKKEEGLKFRPMHTARLTDMICMVSILICLMYDDDDKRNLSDLSKLIPHNFFGNLPSTDVQYLFKRWQNQYKQYTQNVIDHCREYQSNHRYLTEISLDIKNFFPSVSPHFLYTYIVEKLVSAYTGEDVITLKNAITKLLYFKIKEGNLTHWVKEYYGENIIKPVDEQYMNCGIPQGLPQSYFFGNLCMIEVKRLLMADALFTGDAYFYVDDSVIYIQSEITRESFQAQIVELNKKLEEFCIKKNKYPHDLNIFLSQKFISFQSQINYIIRFHEEGKSSFCHIDDADNHLGGFENLAKETSMSSSLYWNMDDIDDNISYKKCLAICEIVDRELNQLKAKESKGNNCVLNEKESSRLKMLKRYKKFYLYRVRMLRMKSEDLVIDEIIKDFEERFSKELHAKDLEMWFELNDEDIFLSEYRLLVQNFQSKEARNLYKKVKEIEQKVLDIVKINKEQKESHYLYFQKDVSNAFAMKGYSSDQYASLKQWGRENYKGTKLLKRKRQFDAFSDFLESEFVAITQKGFQEHGYTSFIAKNSSEYQRRILNAYYSEVINVLCSNDHSFIKSNSRKIHYTELRVLARLRNPQFDLDDFCIFIKRLDNKDISNEMGIDMALLSVIGTFIKTIHNPEWIDCLILTHRITKGLWSNGSKFLNSYTLHNEEHAVTLINQSVHIVKTIDYLTLKPIDYYILFLSCYLHDISMVVHPDMNKLISSDTEAFALISNQVQAMKDEIKKFDNISKDDNKNSRQKESWKFLVKVFEAMYSYFENKVRAPHPYDSAKFIRTKSNTLFEYLEPTLVSFVARVSESHGWDVEDVYGLKSRAKDDTLSIKYLMILIRLADLFDVANDRINYHLLKQNLNVMPTVSKFHWISHLVTDKLEFDADYEPIKEVGLTDKPIEETLIVKLSLNVKYLTTLENKNACKGCSCALNDEYLDIDIKENDEVICNIERCTLLCRWMMKKHEWMVHELIALNKYLYSVNSTLIRTKIKLRLHFSNDMDLDADLFDSVVDYLEECN